MAQRRVPNKEQHSTDHIIGNPNQATMSVDGNAEMKKDSAIEAVEGPGATSKAAALAFMEEKITILVHESTDPNSDQLVFTAVNGINQYFIRGKQQEVRRKYVNVLANAKETGYIQRVGVNEATGNVTQKMIPHTALKYPFSVIEDRNPNGSAWLRQALNQAA